MADLTTAAKFKAAYQITTSGKDTELALLVTAASEWIEGECQRTFSSASYTEYFSPGMGDRRVNADRTELRPRHYPIISVTSLENDPQRDFDASSYLVAASNYRVSQDAMRVRLYQDKSWPTFYAGERFVKLVYVAGYATIPQRLETLANVVTKMMHEILDKNSKQGLSSATMGELTETFRPDVLPEFAQKILDDYRRPFGL